MKTSSLFEMCLNWKVLAGLGVLALLLVLFVPQFAAAAPLLLVLVCPLSMVFMMRGMPIRRGSGHPEPSRGVRHGENHPRDGKENP